MGGLSLRRKDLMMEFDFVEDLNDDIGDEISEREMEILEHKFQKERMAKEDTNDLLDLGAGFSEFNTGKPKGKKDIFNFLG